MHNKTRKNCIKLIKTIEKCKKVVYYEAINKEETGRGTMNNEGGGIVDRRDHDRCRELYVKYRQFMYWYVKKHFPDLPEEDIRDILQEVWTSLLNAIDKLYDKGDEGQFAWLIRVTQTKEMITTVPGKEQKNWEKRSVLLYGNNRKSVLCRT